MYRSLKAAETRKKFYDMASTDEFMVQGYHFPFPSAGYVERNGGDYNLVPIAWIRVL